jgi:proteasome accessory factor C
MAVPAAGAAEQLQRVLTLIPWLRARPGVLKEEAAAAFGISLEQLDADLELAVCAEVGRDSLASIDIDYWGDTVTVLDAQAVDRPLRLRLDEAVSLLVGLRLLAAAPGLPTDAARSALAKIEEALGTLPAQSARVLPLGSPAPEEDTSSVRPEVVAAVTKGLEAHQRLHLAYWVPARDELTQRDVDPVALVVLGARTYLQGWCHLTESMRTFRLDRVHEALLLDEAATPPDVEPVDLPRPGEPWRAGDADHLVVLDLRADARWIVDYHPVESATEGGDGGLRVVLRTPDLAWARRLVLRLGGGARVVEPPELAADVRQAARQALSAYES